MHKQKQTGEAIREAAFGASDRCHNILQTIDRPAQILAVADLLAACMSFYQDGEIRKYMLENFNEMFVLALRAHDRAKRRAREH